MASGDQESSALGVFSTRGLLKRVEQARTALMSLIGEPICYDISEDVVNRVTDLKDRFAEVKIAYVDLQRRYVHLRAHPRVIDDLHCQCNELLERTNVELREKASAHICISFTHIYA